MDKIELASLLKKPLLKRPSKQFELSLFELDMVGGGSSASVLS